MLDVQSAVRDLQVRVAALESCTFDTTNNRLDAMSKNILDAIHELRLDMHAGFGQVNHDIAQLGQHIMVIDGRIDKVYLRLDKHDARFDRLESSMTQGFEEVDARFEKIDSRFEKIDSEFAEIKDLLRSLGAKN